MRPRPEPRNDAALVITKAPTSQRFNEAAAGAAE